ncbi:MAG: response regulator transcription factor [Chloroflexota bacterium]|nr:response regulator transcription factor [Chloroflexota bacterium]
MDGQKPIRVMLVDDHRIVRDGLKMLLAIHDDLEVVAEVGDGGKAIQLCARVEPDVILMDIVMPEMDGPTATARIRESYPHIKIIALTSFLEEDLIQKMLKSGADGYLLKDVSAKELAEAIRASYQGRSTIDPAAAQVLARAVNQPPPLGHDLTEREREVLSLLANGKTNKEIAEELTLSPTTVRGHVSNILSKLGASNRTEATALTLENKLVL